jgi:hypothetical protein
VRETRGAYCREACPQVVRIGVPVPLHGQKARAAWERRLDRLGELLADEDDHEKKASKGRTKK